MRKSDAPSFPQEAVGIVYRRSDTACGDPTAPLCLGTDAETGEPVTIARTKRIAPILITGMVGTGKTTLCHQLSRQQFTPDSSLCYVTQHACSLPEVAQEGPEQREELIIDSDTGSVRPTYLPIEVGTPGSFSGIVLGGDSELNTIVLDTLIGNLRAKRHQQRGPDVPPCTLVLDGIGEAVEMEQVGLRRLFTNARKLGVHLVMTAQSVTQLSHSVQRLLADHGQASITGRVDRTDAQHLAAQYATPTASELTTLPDYQWWLGHAPSDRTDTQFVSPPPSSGVQDDT